MIDVLFVGWRFWPPVRPPWRDLPHLAITRIPELEPESKLIP
jgi:hypothetical protein